MAAAPPPPSQEGVAPQQQLPQAPKISSPVSNSVPPAEDAAPGGPPFTVKAARERLDLALLGASRCAQAMARLLEYCKVLAFDGL